MRENNGLSSLIGQTIKNIEVVDYDRLGEGTRVDELYRITLNDGRKLHFMCDGGDCSHYGSISEIELDENGKVTGSYNPELGEYLGSFKSLNSED